MELTLGTGIVLVVVNLGVAVADWVAVALRNKRLEDGMHQLLVNTVDVAGVEVPAGSPLLSVERRSLTYGERPVELRRGLYRTDAHHYRNELN